MTFKVSISCYKYTDLVTNKLVYKIFVHSFYMFPSPVIAKWVALERILTEFPLVPTTEIAALYV